MKRSGIGLVVFANTCEVSHRVVVVLKHVRTVVRCTLLIAIPITVRPAGVWDSTNQHISYHNIAVLFTTVLLIINSQALLSLCKLLLGRQTSFVELDVGPPMLVFVPSYLFVHFTSEIFLYRTA